MLGAVVAIHVQGIFGFGEDGLGQVPLKIHELF